MKSPETNVPATSGRSDGSLRSILGIGLVTVLVMIAVSQLGRQIVSTLTSPYIVFTRGFSVQEASYVMGTMSLTGIVAAPIGGLFADRLGEKRWLTITMTTLIIALFFFTRVTTIGALFLCAIIYGFLIYSGMGASAALISYFTPVSRRGLGYALFFLPSYIAGAVAPIVATTIAERYEIWSSFSLAMVLLIASVVVLQRIPRA